MTIDKMIEVLTAAKAGKQIQRNKGADSPQWTDFDYYGPTAEWDFFRFNYRIKPEPREWTVWISPDGNIYNQWSSTNWPQILVREVLE